MTQDGHNEYTLGDPPTPAGRSRTFPASMLSHLVRSLLGKATRKLSVLVVVDAAAQGPLIRALEGLNQYNVKPGDNGAYVARSAGLPFPRQVLITSTPDHGLFAAAANRPAPLDADTVIITVGDLPWGSHLARVAKQRETVCYQLAANL